MLYQLYEAQRSFMEPFADFAHTAAKLLNANQTSSAYAHNPFLEPLTQPWSQLTKPFTQQLAASYGLMHRLGKDYVKPAFEIASVKVGAYDVAVFESIESDRAFCELRHFKRLTDNTKVLMTLQKQPTVLIVAPLSGHYATLLRDTVRTMLSDHNVYITDWKNARTVPLSEGSFHLDDYVHYVEDFIRGLQGKHGNIHVVSVCQPTVPVLAAISLMATRGELTPLSMTMMGGPIDGTKTPTAVNNLATKNGFDWFERNLIYTVPSNFPGSGRRVYPGFLQHTGFVAMNADRHKKSHYDYFKDLVKGDEASAEAHRKFYDEYNAVLDMDADYYLETIKIVFQDFALVKGTWEVKNPNGEVERVRPQDIKSTALLTVEGELDDIAGIGQTAAAHGLCAGITKAKKQHFEVKGAGHYGIFSGSRWREQVYPQVKNLIAKYQS